MTEAETTPLYERVGGDQYFHTLVERFYAAVAGDPVIRHLYPEDLGPAAFHLAEFLVQYWGGPPRYSQLRGHPRLRMRHPFPIGPAERDAWLRHMTDAVRGSDAGPIEQAELLDYFSMAAQMLVNQPA